MEGEEEEAEEEAEAEEEEEEQELEEMRLGLAVGVIGVTRGEEEGELPEGDTEMERGFSIASPPSSGGSTGPSTNSHAASE